MSYILDALRRAEHDRLNAQSSPIEQITITPPAQSVVEQTAYRGWVIAAVLITCIAGGALYWAMQRHDHQPQNTASAVPAPTLIPAGQTAPATMQTAIKAPPATPTAVAPAARAYPPSNPSVDTPATPAVNPIADASRLASLDDVMPPQPAPRFRTSRPVSASPSNADLAPTADTDTSIRSPHVTTTTPEQTTPPPVTTSQPPIDTQALKAMPDSYRANFPQINVQVHVYDDDASKRWVLIDGHRYKEGDTLPQGPKIYQIVPEGTVFDWQGQRVLYPVKS